MTIGNVLTIFLMALLDATNPATIGTLFVLLPLVKKKTHALFFVFGTYLIYLGAGIAIYSGVDKLLRVFFISLIDRYDFQIGIIELVLAVVSLGFAVYYLSRLIKRLLRREPSDKDYMAVVVKLVNPFSIIGLAFVSTMMDVPTALPYFAAIAILTAHTPHLVVSMITLAIYCFIYILPMVILYVLFNRIKEEKFNRIAAKFKIIINKSTEYMIPISLLAIAVLLIVNGWGRVF